MDSYFRMSGGKQTAADQTIFLKIIEKIVDGRYRNILIISFALFVVLRNDISVIYVTAHRCTGGLEKKFDLRSASHAIDIS